MTQIAKIIVLRLLTRIQVDGLALVARCLPLCADLFGICHGSGGALRRVARRLDGAEARAALPSLFLGVATIPW